MADIAILGSGGWGMALAVSAHLSGNNVTLWSPFDEEVKMLTEKRCNEKLLSGIVLPDGIKITSDISCVSGSALTILATPSTVIRSVAAQLAEHSITRKYNAVVYNGFTEDEGTVDEPIGRNPQDRKKMAVTQKHSRHAVTHYRVIERMEKFTLIEAQLETGRTHQIRVHMTYIGHPLLGDMVYGPKKQPIHLEGQALHARVLGFIHPRTGEYLEFEAPLPPYFEALLERLRK